MVMGLDLFFSFELKIRWFEMDGGRWRMLNCPNFDCDLE